MTRIIPAGYSLVCASASLRLCGRRSFDGGGRQVILARAGLLEHLVRGVHSGQCSGNLQVRDETYRLTGKLRARPDSLRATSEGR